MINPSRISHNWILELDNKKNQTNFETIDWNYYNFLQKLKKIEMKWNEMEKNGKCPSVRMPQ